MVGGSHHINRLIQLGDVSDDLDAAVALVQNIDLWVLRLKSLLQVIKRQDQAAGAEYHQRCSVLCEWHAGAGLVCSA